MPSFVPTSQPVLGVVGSEGSNGRASPPFRRLTPETVSTNRLAPQTGAFGESNERASQHPSRLTSRTVPTNRVVRDVEVSEGSNGRGSQPSSGPVPERVSSDQAAAEAKGSGGTDGGSDQRFSLPRLETDFTKLSVPEAEVSKIRNGSASHSFSHLVPGAASAGRLAPQIEAFGRSNGTASQQSNHLIPKTVSTDRATREINVSEEGDVNEARGSQSLFRRGLQPTAAKQGAPNQQTSPGFDQDGPSSSTVSFAALPGFRPRSGQFDAAIQSSGSSDRAVTTKEPTAFRIKRQQPSNLGEPRIADAASEDHAASPSKRQQPSDFVEPTITDATPKESISPRRRRQQLIESVISSSANATIEEETGPRTERRPLFKLAAIYATAAGTVGEYIDSCRKRTRSFGTSQPPTAELTAKPNIGLGGKRQRLDLPHNVPAEISQTPERDTGSMDQGLQEVGLAKIEVEGSDMEDDITGRFVSPYPSSSDETEVHHGQQVDEEEGDTLFIPETAPIGEDGLTNESEMENPESIDGLDRAHEEEQHQRRQSLARHIPEVVYISDDDEEGKDVKAEKVEHVERLEDIPSGQPTRKTSHSAKIVSIEKGRRATEPASKANIKNEIDVEDRKDDDLMDQWINRQIVKGYPRNVVDSSLTMNDMDLNGARLYLKSWAAEHNARKRASTGVASVGDDDDDAVDERKISGDGASGRNQTGTATVKRKQECGNRTHGITSTRSEGFIESRSISNSGGRTTTNSCKTNSKDLNDDGRVIIDLTSELPNQHDDDDDDNDDDEDDEKGHSLDIATPKRSRPKMWTVDDDDILRGTNARHIANLERRFGRDALNARWIYLEDHHHRPIN